MSQIFHSGNTILNALMILLALILLSEKFSAFSLSLNTAIDTDQLPFDGWNIGEVHTQSEQISSSPFDDRFSRIDRRATDFTSRYHFPSPNYFGSVSTGYGLTHQEPGTSDRIDSYDDFAKVFSTYSTLTDFPSNIWSNNIRISSKIPFFSSKKSTYKPYAFPVSSLADIIKDKVKAIYPGTLWCGDGNAARSENEVGLFKNTDTCCKIHDKCPSSIPSGKYYKGLYNGGSYTRSHCQCDQQFYNCLKKTNSFISNKIGYTYFNILRPKCFRKAHPVVGCKKWSDKRCRIVAIDGEQTPQWQWFTNPSF